MNCISFNSNSYKTRPHFYKLIDKAQTLCGNEIDCISQRKLKCIISKSLLTSSVQLNSDPHQNIVLRPERQYNR